MLDQCAYRARPRESDLRPVNSDVRPLKGRDQEGKMAKTRQTISIDLPTYQKDRHKWRKDILDIVLRAACSGEVEYDRDDHLEVVVLLYLSKGKRLLIHDVDNRLKDILDALQGDSKVRNSTVRSRLAKGLSSETTTRSIGFLLRSRTFQNVIQRQEANC